MYINIKVWLISLNSFKLYAKELNVELETNR